MSLSLLSKLERANGLEAASGICGMSSTVLFPPAVIFSERVGAEGSDALVWLRSCERQASDEFFTLLVIILLGMVNISVLAL